MDTPILFTDLEWQVARVRRAISRFEAREEEAPGKGKALLDHAIEDLDGAVAAWQLGKEHAEG